MSPRKNVRRGAFIALALGLLAETVATALIATLVTLVLTDRVATGFGGVVVFFALCAFFALVAALLVGIRESLENARDLRAGAFRAAQFRDITLATSDVLAEQADVMAELRALRAEVAELRRPWWRRWGK